MEDIDRDSERPRKRRRREIPKKCLAARLVFDDSLKTDAILVSHSIWSQVSQDLVPSDGDSDSDNSTAPELHACIALTPATIGYDRIEQVPWTIVAAKIQRPDSTDSSNHQQTLVRLPPSSIASQSFLRNFAAVDFNRHGGHVPKAVDVRVTLVTPLVLETVYVTVEKGLLQKVDEIQNKFGGGFQQSTRPAKEKRPNTTQNEVIPYIPSTETRLTLLLRQTLAQLSIIRSGDIFPLPLPSHPITHVRPPPAVAVACEPVDQGIIDSKTKIVIVQAGSSQEKAVKKITAAQPIIEESLEDTAEDTSNDQFYSAAEDKPNETASEIDRVSEEESDSDSSSNGNSDDDSDSMDDLISLSAPGLPPQQAGTLSAMTSATPRPVGKQLTGTHTPGSVYSSFTTATARAGSRPGKVFRTEPLLRKIPKEILHPRPSGEDDEEAFIYVDTGALAKIGCFSGDWVRIEISRNSNGFGLPLRDIHGADEDDTQWRAVKIFGLSGLPSQKMRYAVDKTGGRRSSFSHLNPSFSMSSVAYLSPILLSNMANARFVKIGVLPKAGKSAARVTLPRPSSTPSAPPTAKEVTLLKVASPLATSREFQSILFLGLKQYFESRKRLLKKGDLIAILIDQELGRVVSTGTSNNDHPLEEDLASKLSGEDASAAHGLATAWFSVQFIDSDSQSDRDYNPDSDTWGGVSIVSASQTRLSQAGTTNMSISELVNTWSRYWLGAQSIPRASVRQSSILSTASDLPILEKLPLERRLTDLISAAISPRATHLALPPLVILLHSTQRQIGKTHIANSACSSAGVHSFVVSGHDLLSENASTTGGGDVKTEALLKARAERALSCGANQTAILMQHIDVLTADRLVTAMQEIISSSRVLIATTTKIDDIPAGIRSLFTHELEVSAPDEKARELILKNAALSSNLPLSPSISFKTVALQTAALVAGDLLDLVQRATLTRFARINKILNGQQASMSDVLIAGGQFATHLLPIDFTSAISAARSTFSDAIGAPKIPTVTWNDVGGLSTQKDAIMETISLPLTRPELFANGIRKRSGILFYGPPGTGKTLLAKAIATEFSLNFFSVKGPELLNMYIGESEANVRRVFQRARDARPCVVFFDELDSVAPKRGNQGDSGGVMDRIVSQLLAELDGMSGGGSSDDSTDATSGNNAGGVFVIGATNRPDLLDPALLRPGRFDKMLYLGVASSHEEQVTILNALTRKFTLGRDVDLTRVAGRLPFTYTGADLYALCSDAMLKAITRKTKQVDEKVAEISRVRGEPISTGYFFDHLAKDEDTAVVVEESDFTAAQDELVGSVSAKELEHFQRIRNLFEEQDISSGGGSKNQKSSTMNFGQGNKISNPTTTTTPRVPTAPNTGKGKARSASKSSTTSLTHRPRHPLAIGNPDSAPDSTSSESSHIANDTDSDNTIDDYGVGIGTHDRDSSTFRNAANGTLSNGTAAGGTGNHHHPGSAARRTLSRSDTSIFDPPDQNQSQNQGQNQNQGTAAAKAAWKGKSKTKTPVAVEAGMRNHAENLGLRGDGFIRDGENNGDEEEGLYD